MRDNGKKNKIELIKRNRTKWKSQSLPSYWQRDCFPYPPSNFNFRIYFALLFCCVCRVKSLYSKVNELNWLCGQQMRTVLFRMPLYVYCCRWIESNNCGTLKLDWNTCSTRTVFFNGVFSSPFNFNAFNMKMRNQICNESNSVKIVMEILNMHSAISHAMDLDARASFAYQI